MAQFASHDARDARAAEALHVEILPGTEVMRDIDDVHFTHARGSDGAVLVPHPSSSPEDPLNWSLVWKLTVAISVLLYTWVLVTAALSIAPMFPFLGAEFHLNQTQLGLLTGVNVLTLGFFTIVVVPLSNIFGRRPVSIVSGIFVVLTCIWAALATSHKSLLAARACNGITAATSEVIMVQVVADMFFLHERGLWMGVYFTMYFMGAFLGPIMAGNIAATHGWRSFFWLSTALSLFVTLLLVFTFPETRYFHRTNPQTVSHSQIHSGPPSETSAEKTQEHEKGIDSPRAASDTDSMERGRQPIVVGKGRPNRKQYSALQRPDSRWKQYILHDLLTPLKVFFNPITFWAGLMLAGPADVLLIFNLDESALLGAPPYGWNPGQVGYSNFAFFVGGLVGVATGGPLSDYVAKRLTVRNNGVREAEFRLPALIPFGIITVILHVVGGVGTQELWPWQAILICGYGFSGLSVTTVPTIAIAYAVDCFKPISGEIMIVATILKNTLGFALSYWIFNVAATTTGGWITVYMIQFAITMFPIVMTVPLYFWGKSLRRYYKDSSLHRMEDII